MKRWAVRGSVGDQLTFLSAAHTYARITGEKVEVKSFRDVIESYGDGLLTYADDIPEMQLDGIHLDKRNYGHLSYLGMIQHVLGLPPMPAELPTFKTAESRCLIQPFALTAENPSVDWLQTLCVAFCEQTGEKLHAIGIDSSPRLLQGVEYDLLEDSVPAMMRHIQNARVVLTPRSAAAHIAAMYGTPALMWLPDDGLDWHMQYDGWNRQVIRSGVSLDTMEVSKMLFSGNKAPDGSRFAMSQV